MKHFSSKYIYEYPNWPQFYWREREISALFGEVRNLQGRLFAQMNMLGFTAKEEATLATMTMDVLKTSEIEGEHLEYENVRSSIAKRLGINVGGYLPARRNVDGVVEMMLDAAQNYQNPLTHERLFGWHAALFPTGYSGMYKIDVGCYRTEEMQIVSGAMGKERVHYMAVPAVNVQAEMETFLAWLNTDQGLDPVIKSALANFWFIIIHPFDDGNGRIARAISDLLLARADNTPDRFYSMSSQIMLERKHYYAMLQKVQHSKGDVTEWMHWFLMCLKNALLSTQTSLDMVLKKHEFWKNHEHTELNERQRKMLNKLFEPFDGKLKSSKWAKMTKCSADTALRDIKDLMDKGILRQEQSGGRSTNYELVSF
ncbi:MAG: Fic family protein [Flavobacteriia bacterium]|nr:Fic family protein [Flavobacteriia bacterium]